jgi:redox-sensitive bicupin YhaK (pirin superfamily)
MISAPAKTARALRFRTHGTSHGPITRLVSPGDLGELIKPFVFLDLFSLRPKAGQKGFGLHPHSGIATLTYLIEGETLYEDTTGGKGQLVAGSVEWMQAGNGVWHTNVPAPDVTRVHGFQLWVALPAALENAPSQSQYLTPSQVPREGPARVLLGHYGAAQSVIEAPAPMNYLAVHLKDGEHWRYVPPAGHTLCWVALDTGGLATEDGTHLDSGELGIFEESEAAIEFVAHGDTVFVLGSAVKHPHDLVLGHYSVHTSKAALRQGEAEIQRIGEQLHRQGRLG